MHISKYNLLWPFLIGSMLYTKMFLCRYRVMYLVVVVKARGCFHLNFSTAAAPCIFNSDAIYSDIHHFFCMIAICDAS